MKQPCIGYTSEARRNRDGLSVDVRAEVIRTFTVRFGELRRQAANGVNQLCRLPLTGGCALMYRLPTPGEYTHCCRLKADLIVDHFEFN